MSPGLYKAKGKGLTIQYGFHDCPFGTALVMITDQGLAGLAFADDGDEKAALADMTSRWKEADYVEDPQATAPYAERIFKPENWRPDEPLRVVFIGTDFEIRVWETLLRIPLGRATSYSDIAAHLGKPSAARAVGTAVGRNPGFLRRPVPSRDGKIRKPLRLSLGPDPQTRHPRLGSRRHGGVITALCKTGPCRPACPLHRRNSECSRRR